MTPPALPSARPADLDHLAWLDRAGLTAVSGKATLDLGCGSGALCRRFADAGARHVVGVDLLPPDAAPHGWHHQTLDLDAADWPERVTRPSVGAFDLVLAFDILEHLKAPTTFLEGVRRLMSRDGRVVLTTPNTASWERVLRPESWSGATDPQHRVLFNRYSLGFLIARCGFGVETLASPVRKLGPVGRYVPQVGAQIFCVARAVTPA